MSISYEQLAKAEPHKNKWNSFGITVGKLHLHVWGYRTNMSLGQQFGFDYYGNGYWDILFNVRLLLFGFSVKLSHKLW